MDWRIPPDNFNKDWKDKLGVSLSDNEIVILELAAESSGVSLNESASATGLSDEDARYLLERLIRQALIDLRDANYFIKEHLLALMDPWELSKFWIFYYSQRPTLRLAGYEQMLF